MRGRARGVGGCSPGGRRAVVRCGRGGFFAGVGGTRALRAPGVPGAHQHPCRGGAPGAAHALRGEGGHEARGGDLGLWRRFGVHRGWCVQGAHAQSCTYGGGCWQGACMRSARVQACACNGELGVGADKGVDVKGARGTRAVRGMGLHACTAALACTAVHPCTVVHTQEGACVCSVCSHPCACKHALHVLPSMHAACALCTHAPSRTHTRKGAPHACMCALCLHARGCMCAELQAGTGGTCSVHTSEAQHHPWGVHVPGECMQRCVCVHAWGHVCVEVCAYVHRAHLHLCVHVPLAHVHPDTHAPPKMHAAHVCTVHRCTLMCICPCAGVPPSRRGGARMHRGVCL